MADQPTYTKDPSTGAFYIDSQSGLQLVTDSGTLQGLEQGTIPTETSSPANTTYSPAGGASYQPASATTDPTTGIDSSDPYTRFNMAILDMLRTAQQGGQNTNLIAQGTALNQLQTNTNLNPQTFGGGSVAGLSPSQISQIEGANSNLYTPEQDVVSNAIKAQDSRLSNFEGILSQLNTMGNNIATINPGPDVIKGYINMITAGGSPASIPDAVRPKVLSQMSQSDWAQWAIQSKKGLYGDSSTGYSQYDPNTGTYTMIVPPSQTAAQKNQETGTPTGTGSSAATSQGKVDLTQTEVQKLEGTGLFTSQDIDSLQKYFAGGGDVKDISGLSSDQQSELQKVLVKPPAFNILNPAQDLEAGWNYLKSISKYL